MKNLHLHAIIYFICFVSCSSTKLDNTNCTNSSEENYFIEKLIDKKDLYNLSNKDLSSLKEELISKISSSVTSQSKLFYGYDDKESYEFFGTDVSDVSYGFLNDPEIVYCKRNKNYFVVLSINKRDFTLQTADQLVKQLEISLDNIRFSLSNFDKSKETFNMQEAKRYNLKFQQLQSMHELVANQKNFTIERIKSLNNDLASLGNLTYDFTKRSYIFDDQKRSINNKIKDNKLKSAYVDLNMLLNAYGRNSSEGTEVLSIINGLKFKISQEWKYHSKSFNDNIRLKKINAAQNNLNKLNKLVINGSYNSKYDIFVSEYRVARRKFEKNQLLIKSPKNQELYFGINATTSYGNILSSNDVLLLDPQTSNFNFDKFLPAFKIGYRYYFNPKKRLGIFFQYKSNSNKFIQLSSDTDSDYEFPFTNNFNEAQVGFSAGPFDFSFGKILNKMNVNDNEVDFNTASVNLSIITTDGSPKGKKNYFNLYGGVNLISDMEDLSYTNLVIGLNYHLRFNRKLSKENRKYLSTL